MIASRSFHVLANFTFIRFSPVLNGLLEFEFAVQSHDIAFHIAEQKYQSIESCYHRFADVLHRSAVGGRGIVNYHCDEQTVVLVGNLQIGGRHEGRLHLDHLAISSDINHVRSTEESE